MRILVKHFDAIKLIGMNGSDSYFYENVSMAPLSYAHCLRFCTKHKITVRFSLT